MKKEKKEANGFKSPMIHIGTVVCDAQFREIESPYVSSTGLFIGKICVASFYYDGTRPKENAHAYKVVSALPSIKRELGYFATTKECEEKCLSVARTFCKQLETTE